MALPDSRWDDDVYGPAGDQAKIRAIQHFVDLFSGGTLDFDDDSNGDDYCRCQSALFGEYLKELRDAGATDAEMLDAYNENLLLLKKSGDGFFSNKSGPMSTIANRYASADTTASDDAIGEALGKAIRHARGVIKREHVKADRIEAVNQFIVSIRRELSYVRSRVASDVMSLASKLESKYTWHDIGVPAAADYKVNEWLAIAKRKSYSADAQSELINTDLEELERGLQAVRHAVDDMERINREGEVVAQNLCAVFNPSP
jgi:hypothetical protein